EPAERVDLDRAEHRSDLERRLRAVVDEAALCRRARGALRQVCRALIGRLDAEEHAARGRADVAEEQAIRRARVYAISGLTRIAERAAEQLELEAGELPGGGLRLVLDGARAAGKTREGERG